MKKSYFKYILVFLIAFSFNFITVYAENICVYGEGKGTSWTKKLTLDLDASNPFVLNESPFLTDKPNKGVAFSSLKKSSSSDKSNGIHFQYYANIKAKGLLSWGLCDAKVLNGIKKVFDTCPAEIYVAYNNIHLPGNAFCTNAYSENNIAFYVDDLSNASTFLGFDENGERMILDSTGMPVVTFWDNVDKKKIFVLEENKDKDEKEYNSTGCQTFEKYIEKMTEAAAHNDGSCDNNNEFDDLYGELQELCERYRSSTKYVDGMGKAKGCMSACTGLRDTVDIICNKEKKGGYCGSLGNGIVNWIFRIIRIIRYVMPALLIILSILDFIKAIAEEDESKMKDATKRFIRRLIAVALLFIIPFIINFILRIFNIPGLNASNPFCAK